MVTLIAILMKQAQYFVSERVLKRTLGAGGVANINAIHVCKLQVEVVQSKQQEVHSIHEYS